VVPEDGQGTVGGGSITRDNLQKLENASVCFAPNIQFLENLDLFKDTLESDADSV
jgi:hypothetical protein